MKKLIFLFAIATIGFASCRETKTETKEVIREVEVEQVEAETPVDNEGILERTAKEVDKEVNEEIDKKIEEIGNDK